MVSLELVLSIREGSFPQKQSIRSALTHEFSVKPLQARRGRSERAEGAERGGEGGRRGGYVLYCNVSILYARFIRAVVHRCEI
jgi:hypothetical protein